ncbi:MAG: signal peptidase II [Actinomycetota bacterium]
MIGARRPAVWLFVAATVAYTADRLTKLWALEELAHHPPITLIPKVLDLRYTDNSGGAFGVGQSAPWLFATATILASVAIVVASFYVRHRSVTVALGLILGGALGNLTDRLLRGDGFLTGRVVDFIDVHIWPVFNLADSAIVVGALLFAITTFRRGEE